MNAFPDKVWSTIYDIIIHQMQIGSLYKTLLKRINIISNFFHDDSQKLINHLKITCIGVGIKFKHGLAIKIQMEGN
jgi:hypothetical protein